MTQSIILLTSDMNQLCLGISDFARPRTNWRISVQLPTQHNIHAISAARVDGVIAHLHRPKDADFLASLEVPVVNYSGVLKDCPLPRVTADNRKAGQLAAAHFLERGFSSLAYLGITDGHHNFDRGESFRESVEQEGITPVINFFPSRDGKKRAISQLRSDLPMLLTSFVMSLPNPCGLFCENDRLGFQVVQACNEAGLQVPEQIAVLGMDNSEAECMLCFPPLSSVINPRRKIGYEAAKLLHGALSAGKPKCRELRISPERVVARQSTDVLAISDPAVLAAIREIRSRAFGSLSVDEVVRASGVSRRSLEIRFRKMLSRTPLQEITRVRLENAKKLLRETTECLPDIAEASGFPSINWLHSTFTREVGTSPARYRRQYGEPRTTE